MALADACVSEAMIEAVLPIEAGPGLGLGLGLEIALLTKA